MIVYPYKNLQKDIIKTIPDGYAYGNSEKGWMTFKLYLKYIKDVFYAEVVRTRGYPSKSRQMALYEFVRASSSGSSGRIT